ncbi:hypothetical protein ABIF38_006374 [Bradyrhizobium japonicum]|uniref:Transposase n=1 Tax=Bradyrhizobium elkanii TaxID=29448 RepID=A0ABV4F1D1_BRAEL|nr:hypothetical protein [Bradyrhizobium elkanii]MBP2426513.1 hypothetical protein [Bradyrhizobium elkanii]MCP1758266.1 hypothetical protein [Bradyrhizobium elkanii]MCP1931839.1 hypothetical protein [Bradyrhizobium elkanii]MCP1983582.1 hypothetical protein [Bradyrhizobium elkanii]MCS3516841.1 hypothetical protein [Bradyrhizobium elkanii]
MPASVVDIFRTAMDDSEIDFFFDEHSHDLNIKRALRTHGVQRSRH